MEELNKKNRLLRRTKESSITNRPVYIFSGGFFEKISEKAFFTPSRYFMHNFVNSVCFFYVDPNSTEKN